MRKSCIKRYYHDKERKTKTLKKINKTPITTELGNVTPFIIHPGNLDTI